MRRSAAEKMELIQGVVSKKNVQVPACLTRADRLAAWKARWGINRKGCRVRPGLYAVGRPSSKSPVIVSANYKLSFDALRKELGNIDAWIMVLDTKGVNVWCSAGKGTFGTLEIMRRIIETHLENTVSHRTLILPQLCAPGVSAHNLKKYSGFSVVYGPVRAMDLPEFLRAGMKASPEMRRVNFTFRDRLALVPVELVNFGKYIVPAAALLFILGLKAEAVLALCAMSAGSVVAPALLPWLPGRSFSAKGAFSGLVLSIAAAIVLIYAGGNPGPAVILSWIFMSVPVSSFTAMFFTGASTYTSLSGVQKEMRLAVPVQAGLFLAGIIIGVTARFL